MKMTCRWHLKDINAQAPVHILLIPKKPIPRLAEAESDDANLPRTSFVNS